MKLNTTSNNWIALLTLDNARDQLAYNFLRTNELKKNGLYALGEKGSPKKTTFFFVLNDSLIELSKTEAQAVAKIEATYTDTDRKSNTTYDEEYDSISGFLNFVDEILEKRVTNNRKVFIKNLIIDIRMNDTNVKRIISLLQTEKIQLEQQALDSKIQKTDTRGKTTKI